MTTSKRAAHRPLSPHLGIWRWPATMASSILHRMTGVGNALGTLVLAWWLIALASGPVAYGVFSGFIGSLLGRFILFGFTLSLCYHLLNGIRHLFWDTGRGFDVTVSIVWSWVNIIGAIALSVAVWAIGYSMMGGM